MTIGQLIKEARQQAGLSQDKLALRAGVNEGSYVSRWERGEIVPTVRRMRKIIEALPLDEEKAWAVWKAAQDAKRLRRS